MLPTQESLTVEFKSERKRPQSDSEIVGNIVALANTQGGSLYLGIEDDGTVTGVSQEHENTTGLESFIFNKTRPPMRTRTERIPVGDKTVVRIEIHESEQIVSTSDARTLQRRLKADGSPEVVPLYPEEFISRHSQQRRYDYSDQPAPTAEYSDLDPAARNKLRDHIRQTRMDSTLLSYSDEDFDRTLELVKEEPDGTLTPSITGMLIIGRPESIARCVPSAKASFQVMKGLEPVVNNDSLTLPLVDMFDTIDDMFTPWNPSHEIMSGLVHTNIHDYPPQAFREAIVNAFCHRDYSRLGNVIVKLDDNSLTISNPGGFIEGITDKNLLSAQPRSRNPQLATVLKIAGYAERTGRGVDTIYADCLAAGGAQPDYASSNAAEVVLFMRKIVPDERFVTMITKEERRLGSPLSVWALIILSLLKEHHQLTHAQLCDFSSVEEQRLMSAMGMLIETGLVEAIGSGKSRSYMLSPDVYKRNEDLATYVRQKGASAARRDAMILDYAQSNGGTITTSEAMELLGVSYITAYRCLKTLEDKGQIVHEGGGPKSAYRIS